MAEEKKEGLSRLGIFAVSSPEDVQDLSDLTEETDSEDDSSKVFTVRRGMLMASLYLALYLPTLNQTIVSTALPKILSEINVHGSDIGYTWIGSAYALAQAMMLPLFGKLARTPGRKWALLVAMSVFMLGSALCGASGNIEMMLASRTIQGLGAGGVSGLCFVLVMELVRVRGVGKYSELIAAAWAIVAAIGPFLGGTLSEKANWRWCFFMNVPISVICAITIWVLLPSVHTDPGFRRAFRAFDLCGVMIIGVGKVLVTLGFQWAIQNESWTSPEVLTTLLAGAGALGAFVPVEMSASSPVVPFSFLKHRTRVGSYVSTFFHSIAFSGLNYWLPLYFQAVKQQSASESGISMLAWTLSFAIISAAAGFVIIAMKRYLEIIWSGFILACIACALLTILNPQTPMAIVAVLLAVAGTGFGPNFNSPLIPIHASFDISLENYESILMQSTEAYTFLRSLGSSIGISASGLVFFEDLAQHQLPTLSVFNMTQAIENAHNLTLVEESANVEVLHGAMQHVFIQVCVVMGIGLSLSFLIRRHPFTSNTEGDEEDDGIRGTPRVDSFGIEDG
ncbi:hypothetical protein JX265_000805 [Neoarthrinium moseri]|uniref:Major facilitator superfamily (MFS) profile domain-containing protein n=1 Tax=Neoarthrinium moseri TaxID=1658444 RepID=A0A9P9WWM9_9PEZI|nr:uncharacterized protein JN550_007089 [Neoarthrinium moseri]KAI1867358.1 hypothetical protein JN550_007089 [Neoarthrinium moseri]KAI1880565.1 hypothetical protein JX265_000805 [Neoarthrinium moseri]